jgi:hypothetical protein
VDAIDDHELAVQHLAIAFLGTLQQVVLPDAAGANAQLHAGYRIGGDELTELARGRSRAVVVTHGMVSYR